MSGNFSVRLMLFGWVETVLGLAGSILFLYSLDWFSFSSFHFFETNIEKVYTIGVNVEQLSWAFFYGTMTFPFVVMLVCGIGTMKRRRWARKINLLLLPPLVVVIYIFAYAIFSYFKTGIPWKPFCLTVVPLTFFTLFELIFLTRPEIRGQFH
jgi:hypothetical protein